jgi:hypothetical protein
MPISSGDFEKTERETSPMLLDILRTHPLNAYGLDELVEMLAAMGRKLPIEEVEKILALLEYGGKAESRVIDGITYYKYRASSFSKPPTRPK